MTKTVTKLPVTILRGGTSKGVYILETDLPADKTEWEPLLLRLMGSPDKKQIDGLGGSQSVTSKVAIVKRSDHPDADVDYTFAQVSVDKPLVSYKGNCGNISSGVGPFAIEKGLVEPKDGLTSVRIYNTNTDKIIEADVHTTDGCVDYDGDFAIAGVPGHIAAGILMTTFAVYLAFEMKINPITTALFAKLGANAGCASPLSLTGQLGLKLTNNLIEDNADIANRLSFSGAHSFIATLVSGFIFTVLLYIFTKSYKVKADNPLKLKDIPKFNWKQWVTIAAIVLMVVLCIGFQMNTGLTASVMATILVLLKCADEKQAIKGVPWGTLMFICGVGVLVAVIDMLGGIDLISGLLQKLMGPKTATPVLSATSGILSWVSSTTGVVMPAMFKMLPNIMRNFGDSVNYMEMISAITATSFAAAISPLSTGGAIIMSSYSASKETTNAELNKIFKFLFLLSVANVLLNVLLSWIGVFSLGGLF